MPDSEILLASLLEAVKKNREAYSSILKANPAKEQLLNPESREQFLQIVRSEIGLCDELLSGSIRQTGLLQSLFTDWEHLGAVGINSAKPEERALHTATEEIGALLSLLKSLKSTLSAQTNAPIEQLPKLLEAERQLHRTIRRTFFYFLRTLIDYMRNLEQKKPLIAVVVPAHNEERYIQRCARAVRSQTYPNKRLIIVNNNSTDATAKVALPYSPGIRDELQRGVAFARNNGGQQAIAQGAEIIVFLDADSQMRPDLLEKVWEAVCHEGKLAGICKTKLDEKHVRARIFTFLHNLNRRVFKIPHTFMFCTKDVFLSEKFRPSLQIGEDVEWAHRVIKRIGYRRFKVIIDSWLITSARRFEKNGYLRTLLRWSQTWPFGLLTGKKDTTYFD